MTKEAVYVGVDVAKDTLEVAHSSSRETRQFGNAHEGIARAVEYIASTSLHRKLLICILTT